MHNLQIHTTETRQFERRPYEETITYSLVAFESDKEKTLNLNGKSVDISDSGIGIETDYPLAPGHMLWFGNGMKHNTGLVRWSTRVNGNYRVGIKLDGIGKSLEVNEEAQEYGLQVSEERERYNELLDSATERFNKELEDIEERCHDSNENPQQISSAIEKAINQVLIKCAEFESGVKDKDVIRNAKITFREKTNPILSKSYFINRSRTWPQGYQGDHKTLENLYRNTPLSEGIGYYLDLCSLNAPLAHAVRNRIKKLEEILRTEIEARQHPSLLNIACGSCRELMGIAPEIIDSEARITCIDSDNDALAFAQDRLSYAGIIQQVELRKYNALRMFDDEMNMMEFGKQDIIYSVGLFDYLPDDFLVKLLKALFTLLNHGGKLIAAFKDSGRYRSQDYHWIVDWDGFLQRKEEDFRRILCEAGIPHPVLSESREESGVIAFYIATK